MPQGNNPTRAKANELDAELKRSIEFWANGQTPPELGSVLKHPDADKIILSMFQAKYKLSDTCVADMLDVVIPTLLGRLTTPPQTTNPPPPPPSEPPKPKTKPTMPLTDISLGLSVLDEPDEPPPIKPQTVQTASTFFFLSFFFSLLATVVTIPVEFSYDYSC
jgi:hypothetical protein